MKYETEARLILMTYIMMAYRDNEKPMAEDIIGNFKSNGLTVETLAKEIETNIDKGIDLATQMEILFQIEARVKTDLHFTANAYKIVYEVLDKRNIIPK